MRVRKSIAFLAILIACDPAPSDPLPQSVPVSPIPLGSTGAVFVMGLGGDTRALSTSAPFKLWDLNCPNGRFMFEVIYDSLFFFEDPARRNAYTDGGFRRSRLVHQMSGVRDEYLQEGGEGSFSLEPNKVFAHYQKQSTGSGINPEFEIRSDTLVALEEWGVACAGGVQRVVGRAEWRWMRR